ncbi:MAG: hypothetical protein U9N86_05660 [Bacteroidota bacterium]|nr:hypothetical protein [Bacteroidota bacterium]
MNGANHYSVRYQDWHYINYNGQEEELYQQTDDPEEWMNLANDSTMGNVNIMV